VLEFRVLGPLEVVGETGALRLGGPRQRATLAILLLQANRVVPVERLADELYAGRPPVSAVTQVQRQISELRRVLGTADAIETRPPGYVIRVAPDGLDLQRFEALLERGVTALRSGHAETAAEDLRAALMLWRGPALADLSYEPFAQGPVARLEERSEPQARWPTHASSRRDRRSARGPIKGSVGLDSAVDVVIWAYAGAPDLTNL